MVGTGVTGERGGQGAAEVAHRRCQSGQLGRVQLIEDPLEDLFANRFDLVKDGLATGRDPNQDDPSIARDTDAFDVAAFLDAVDETRRVRIGDVEHLGEPAHGDLAVPFEEVHDVELGHADPETHHALALETLELAHGDPEIGDDSGLGRGRWIAAGLGRDAGRDPSGVLVDGSCHLNYSRYANNPVKTEHPDQREETMRFALMIEPQQGMSYGDQVAVAKRAEANGFEALFRSDHYASFPGEAGKPTTDAWAVLAGLSRETDRIGLGALVSPVTFRHPGNFAKVVTTVDEMSGGRIEVGVGAGWNDLEHRQLGLDFPPIEERADLLEDQLAILHGLWGEPDGWSFDGHRVSIREARFQPKPVDVPGRPRTSIGGARPRLLVGGSGTPRSYRIAARYADEFNLNGTGPDGVARKYAAIDEACRAIGRDPASLTRSVMAGTLIGRDQAEVERRVAAGKKAFGADDADGDWLAERGDGWVSGTPDQAREAVRRFAAVGVERIMLQDLLPWDLDMIDVMGEELVGRV